MSQEATYSQKNQKYWDTHASSYDSPKWARDLTSQLIEQYKSRTDWIGVEWAKKDGSDNRVVRMLDYACGNGAASRALFPYFSQVRGMDLSSQMVKEYNVRADAEGLSPEDMHAIQGDLTASLAGLPDSLREGRDYFDFDLAVMNMALHHVDTPGVVIRKLVERLNKRGVLVIVDLTLKGDAFNGLHGHGGSHGHEHGHHGHGHESHVEEPSVSGPQHTISFQGFDKEQMEKYFTEAGCVEFEYVEFKETTRIGDGDGAMTKLLFMARGRKVD